MDIIGAKSKAYGIGKSRLKKKSQISSLSELAKSKHIFIQKYYREK